MQGESDEEIVSTTMSELSAILVLVFFMCVALVVVAGRETAKPRSEFPSSALQAKLIKAGCSFNTSEGGTALDVLTLSDLAQNEGTTTTRNVLFEIGKSVPTPFGQACFTPVCDELVEILGSKILPGELIFINGHTSSEWGDQLLLPGPDPMQFCSGTSRETCEPCLNAFDCNLMLSTRRAISIFRLCHGRMAADGKDADGLDNATFYSHFRVGGISSAETIVVDEVEDAAGSRRVDFVIQQR
jgi:hypothetical protein